MSEQVVDGAAAYRCFTSLSLENDVMCNASPAERCSYFVRSKDSDSDCRFMHMIGNVFPRCTSPAILTEFSLIESIEKL